MKNLNPLFEYMVGPYVDNLPSTSQPYNFPGTLPQYVPPAPTTTAPATATTAPAATTTPTTAPTTTTSGTGAKNANPASSLSPAAIGLGAYAGTAITGLGTKIGKDMLAAHKIISKYPDPKSLANTLKNMDSNYAKKVALKLYAVKDMSEYKTVVRKYILKGTMGRYFWHMLTGPVSTVLNTLGVIDNAQDSVTDMIGSNVR